MKKITLWLFMLFACSQMNAQLWNIVSCGTGGSTAYGPMYIQASAGSNNRTAVIYPAAQLTNIVGQNLNAMYFNRTTATGSLGGTPNFKIYLKEVVATDFGSGAIDWATETTGATLVYDSSPAAAVGTTAGWKMFPLSTNFLYSGQNLAVFYEYINTSSNSVSISWNYEFTSPCSDIGNSNTTKYNNNTTGILATSLASTNYRRPMIGFDFVVTCNAPTNLVSSNLTTNSVDIAWTENATQPQNGYEYYYSPSDVAPLPSATPSGTTATGITTTSLSSLTPATNYYMWVRGNCGASDKSIWTGPIIFSTACTQVASFVENFDTSPTGIGNLPVCWSKLGTSANVYANTGALAPMSPTNRLYMNINATTTAFAIMPPVSNLQANTHRLKFKTYCVQVDKILSVGYFTIPGDELSYVELQQFIMPSTVVANTQEFTVIPTTVPAGVTQLAFKLFSGATTTAYIDDVKWEVNSSCVEPSALTASMITNNSATLGWTSGGSETTWDIQYGLTGFSLGSGTIINGVTVNPHVLSGLMTDTSYQFYVRGVCTGPQNSAWFGPFLFRTQCDDVTSFSENFDSYPTGSTNPIADCWTKGGTGFAYLSTGATAPFMSPANRLYMSASGSSTAPTEVYAILPPVSNLQANTHRLKFKGYATAIDRVIEVGYLTDPSNVNTFVSIQGITLPSTAIANTQEFIIVPTGIPAGVKNLALKNPGFPLATSTMYIDDVSWQVIPSCLETNSLVSSMVTNNTAIIGWTEGGTATQWEIEYGAPGFTNGTGTIVSAPTNPFTLTGLMQDTAYDFYVRAVCSTTDSSSWTGPSSFNTLCDDQTELFENFDSYPIGSSNPLGDCWTKGGTGSVYLLSGSNAPMSPSNRIYMSASGTASPPTECYAILPALSNLQANTHRLKFKAYATAANRVLQVGYLTDPTDVTTFVQIQEITLPSSVVANTQEFTIVPTGIPTGVKFLTIKNPGFPSSSTVAYIDDVIWEAIPACPGPTTLIANGITSSSANLSWTEMGSATTWNIEYGTTGYTQGTGTLLTGVTSNPYTLSSIANSTTFDFYVQADCGGTAGSSIWIGPISFSTLCVASLAPYTQNFDSLALVSPFTALPNCWDAQTGPDYWDVTNDVINALNTYAPNVGDHTTGTSNYMWIDSSSNITANEMVSPLVDISGLTNPYVGFWFLSENTTNTINHTIALDVWDGSAWLNIATHIGNFTTWVQVGAAIPTTVPTTTKFRIYAIANPNGVGTDYYYNDLGVDDFFVSEDPTLSTSNFDNASFVAYPNPVKDVLNLSYSSEMTSVKVINLLGQEVISRKVNSTTSQIDMTTLTAGAYIVYVTIGDVVKTIKVIKN